MRESKIYLVPYIFIFLLAVVALYRVWNAKNTPIISKDEVEGVILKHPKVKNDVQSFEIDGIQIKTGQYPKYYLGDRLDIKSNHASGVENQQPIRLGQTRYAVLNFLLSSHLPKKYQYSQLQNQYRNIWYYPKIELVGAVGVLKSISIFRENLIVRVQKALPEPHSSLVLGMTMGYENNVPESFEEMLKRVGIIHVVVVSGYNVTLILSIVSIFLSRLGKSAVLIGSVTFLFILLFLVGLEPPVIRAVIMGIIASIGLIFGQQRSSMYLLFIAGLGMVIFHPEYVSDISFQMSFLASFIVVLLSSIVRKLPAIVGEIVITLLVNLAMLPIISYYFKTISLLGLIANPLLLWIVPFITTIGMIFMFLNISVLAFLLVFLLDFFLFVCKALSSTNWGVYEYAISIPIMMIFYIFYFTLLRFMYLFTKQNG